MKPLEMKLFTGAFARGCHGNQPLNAIAHAQCIHGGEPAIKATCAAWHENCSNSTLQPTALASIARWADY